MTRFNRFTKACKSALILAAITGFGFTAEDCPGQPTPSNHQGLKVQPICLDTGVLPPNNAWLCGQTLNLECGTQSLVDLYVQAQDTVCQDLGLKLEQSIFVKAGTYQVNAQADADGDGVHSPYCSATLELEDTQPPVITSNSVVELWPPNHKFHTVNIDDCVKVKDACDDDLDIAFISLTSDEGENGQGDGNTSSDVQFTDCQNLALRSERQGGSDGRVYSAKWRATDDSGNITEGICKIVVPHSQGKGGQAVDSGAAYQLDFSSTCN